MLTSDISVCDSINVNRNKPICLPDKLKTVLGDDWTFVNHQKKLINLPAQITINDILLMFLNEKKKSISQNQFEMIVKDINYLKKSFNTCINKRFLYTFEKHQYNCITEKHKDLCLCEVYGIQHLLRFLSHIETDLTNQKMNEISKNQIRTFSQDILDYIDNNFSKIFSLKNYFSPNLEYHQKSFI